MKCLNHGCTETLAAKNVGGTQILCSRCGRCYLSWASQAPLPRFRRRPDPEPIVAAIVMAALILMAFLLPLVLR